VGRAAGVLVLFIVATVALLGLIHPSSASTIAATTTTTTAPAGSHAGTGHTTTTTTTAPPASVAVQVANGTSVAGAAGVVTNQLKNEGWHTLPAANATAHVTNTSVYYVAGQETAAKAVAKDLGLPATDVGPYTTEAPITSIGSADVLVVVGPALANSAAAASTTTTTTKAP
jgi:hypothetical protein